MEMECNVIVDQICIDDDGKNVRVKITMGPNPVRTIEETIEVGSVDTSAHIEKFEEGLYDE